MKHSVLSKRVPGALLALLVLVLCLTSGAQGSGTGGVISDLSIEELMKVKVDTVYGASRFEQKTTEAPSSVSVITSEDFKRYGWRTLGDALKSIRGYYVSYDGQYQYLGVRGFSRPGDYNARILLLIDGHRVNDNIYNTAPIGNDLPVDVDLIERVEIIRGPGSSLYGSNAFFGVINVIMRKGGELQGMELSADAGSFDTARGRVTAGYKFRNGFEFVVSGSGFRGPGQNLFYKEFVSPQTNFGWNDRGDYERFGSVFASISFKDFTLQGAYQSREKTIPTAAWLTVFNTRHTKAWDRQGYIDLKYEKLLDADSQIMARVFYDYYRYDGRYLLDEPEPVLNRDLGLGKRWGAEANFTKRILMNHKVTVGAEYVGNIMQKQLNYNDRPYEMFLDDRRRTHAWSVYLQDEFTILDNLVLNAGVRYNHFTDYGSKVTPRIALIYRPLENTTLKFIYGQAFRTPNVYEQYYNDGGITQKASQRLRPETIHIYEVILEQYWRRYRLSVSGFYKKINNLISFVTDPIDGLNSFRNIDDAISMGGEFEAQGKFSYDIEARLSYTFQKTYDAVTKRVLSNSPRHLVKVNLFVPVIKEKLATGVEIQYMSGRRTLHNTIAGGFMTANMTLLSRGLVEGLELSASVYNILDKKYGDPASSEHRQYTIGQDGRTFRVKATYRF